MCQMLKARIKKIKLYTISDIEHQWNSVTLSQRNWRDRYEWKTDIDFSLIFQAQQANTDISKSALALWQAGIGGLLVVFAPMLLSMGYILLLSEETSKRTDSFSYLTFRKLEVLHFQGV